MFSHFQVAGDISGRVNSERANFSRHWPRASDRSIFTAISQNLLEGCTKSRWSFFKLSFGIHCGKPNEALCFSFTLSLFRQGPRWVCLFLAGHISILLEEFYEVGIVLNNFVHVLKAKDQVCNVRLMYEMRRNWKFAGYELHFHGLILQYFSFNEWWHKLVHKVSVYEEVCVSKK